MHNKAIKLTLQSSQKNLNINYRMQFILMQNKVVVKSQGTKLHTLENPVFYCFCKLFAIPKRD